MKKITYNDLETIFPNTVKILEDESYLDVYSLYHKLVVNYLIKNFKLTDFDNYFKESSLNYKSINNNNMDIYQYLSSESLSYFYLRNNIHIEKLDKNEYNYFVNKLNNNDEILDENTEKMIEITLNKVLSENNNKIVDTNYGPSSGRFFAPSNSLVIGFRYDEFNDEGMTDKEWDLNHEEQISDIFSKFCDLEEKVEDFSIMPVRIIQYNDYSIKKKATNSMKIN